MIRETALDARRGAALKSLVYSSLAVTRFYEPDLAALLTAARAHNESAGITGILLYNREQFIQFLEGPPDAVDALVDRIRRDSRHTFVRVLVDELVEERQFEDWSMGYRRPQPSDAAPPQGFRDSFSDIAAAPDEFTTGRAAKELALWFRVRAGRIARRPA